MLIVSDVKSADNVIQKFYNRGVFAFKIKGVAILQDEDFVGNKNTQILKKIQGVDIVACNREGVFEYIEQNVVDEIIFSGHCDCDEFKSLIAECEMIGLTVHIVIDQIDSLIGETAVEKMAGVPMFSSTIRMVSSSDMLLKRLLDIVGSIVGLIITGISFIFVAPAIYISDPGPIFFAQERIGKNGRRFKIYKYRSMYKDAEKRKTELMSRNEMKGLMFKMENDPRIIGSGIDGNKKGVGNVLASVGSVIPLFKDQIANAQLVCTSHDTWQMSRKFLRRDQIWFTEKDSSGLSSLYSLSKNNLKKNASNGRSTSVRNDESYEKHYMEGDYGAVPKLSSIDMLLDE